MTSDIKTGQKEKKCHATFHVSQHFREKELFQTD